MLLLAARIAPVQAVQARQSEEFGKLSSRRIVLLILHIVLVYAHILFHKILLSQDLSFKLSLDGLGRQRLRLNDIAHPSLSSRPQSAFHFQFLSMPHKLPCIRRELRRCCPQDSEREHHDPSIPWQEHSLTLLFPAGTKPPALRDAETKHVSKPPATISSLHAALFTNS